MMLDGRRVALVRSNGRRKIVQAVAERPKSGFVVPAIGNDACCCLNNRLVFGELDNPPALQQPDQACLVVAGYPARVVRSRAFFLCVVHAIGCHAQPLSVH